MPLCASMGGTGLKACEVRWEKPSLSDCYSRSKGGVGFGLNRQFATSLVKERYGSGASMRSSRQRGHFAIKVRHDEG